MKPLTMAALNMNMADLYDEPKGATYRYDNGRTIHRTPDKRFRQANTGKKTLRYEDSTREQQTEYNYSTHSEIQQLTKSFQSIALTMEFARHLQYFRRYQPLALEEDLKRMEEMARDNDLKELQAIAPILKDIAEDKSILNVARVRAQRLVALGAKPSSQ
jgi:hypothetical protein